MYFIRLRQFLFVIYFSFVVFFIAACWRPPGIGIGGQYLDAKVEVTKRSGDLNKAIANLEYVVTREPFYEDSLTLLGRAYYKKRRYPDAYQIFTRAVAVNREDEIAWIMLALTQLRLQDNVKGFESLKGGLTLLSRASKDGYKGIEFWDKNGLVRLALSRAAFAVMKGPEEKETAIARTEALLATIDNEEWFGRGEQYQKAIRPD
jgi:tetratricopeptide (TPR) repeat protein